jgi:N-acetylglucosaminyldiphosphoundecaprenol N-acetyl-beta-D-mannosaminyltransferase
MQTSNGRTAAPSRVLLGGVPLDPVTRDEAIQRIDELVKRKKGGAVFTPNVDHVVEFAQNAGLRAAYADADLSLVDGMPVLWASRLLGDRVPEKVSGSDLTMPLLTHAAEEGWRVFLLGGREGAAELAAKRLDADLPGIVVAGTLCPRVDMNEPKERRQEIVDAIRAARADIVLVALGAPKQELFIHETRAALAPSVLLGLGASIDFIAGTVPRAPAWMSNAGLEWLYRLTREPRRLWKRYLVRDPKFAVIFAGELFARRRRSSRSSS